MTDDDLLKLMFEIDHLTVRIPPGIRAIAAKIEATERERCKRAVYDATDWAHEPRDFVLKEAIVNWIDGKQTDPPPIPNDI